MTFLFFFTSAMMNRGVSEGILAFISAHAQSEGAKPKFINRGSSIAPIYKFFCRVGRSIVDSRKVDKVVRNSFANCGTL